MKQLLRSFFILLLLQFSISDGNAQNTFSHTNGGRWTIGLNFGGTFQTSDVDPIMKVGGGGYLGYSIIKRRNSFFNVDIRGRFLAARTRGRNLTPSFTANLDPSVNGTYDPDVNFTDSLGGMYYANFRTKAMEGSGELVIGLNRLRERTGIVLYGFGGGGAYSYKVDIDQKDDFWGPYDYSKVGTSNPASDLRLLRDGKYESDGYNSRSRKTILTPTLGYGFGYQVAQGFSIILEHKMTFPMNSELDGQAFAAPRTGLFKNDVQHFIGLNFEFMFGHRLHVDDFEEFDGGGGGAVGGGAVGGGVHTGGGGKVGVGTGGGKTGGGIGTGKLQDKRPPIVNITTPSARPYNATSTPTTLVADVLNVGSKMDIEFMFNSKRIYDFTFNPNTHKVVANLNLVKGTNSVVIKATNKDGSAQDQITIFLKEGELKAPPQVKFTDPATSPLNVNNSAYTIKAEALNITSSSQLTFSQNGINKTNFTYNAATGAFTHNAALQKGSNVFVITATNKDGVASDQTILVYEALPAPVPPVVTIQNPPSSPYKVQASPFTFMANVKNVSRRGQIEVKVNGAKQLNFIFDTKNGQVQLPMMLQKGSTTVTVTATNNAGKDSKSATIIYEPPVAAPPPTVHFVVPAVQPSTVASPTYTAVAQVTNVTNRNQITVIVNNAATTNYTFNTTTLQVLVPMTLNKGTNTITVKATNNVGSDSKTVQVNYVEPPKPPTVVITNPVPSPTTVYVPSFAFKAKVTNVKRRSQLQVYFNGSLQSNFMFNVTTGIVELPVTLIKGANNFTVTATNNGGSDTKSAVAMLVDKALPPVVTITNPAVSPHTTNSAAFTLTANVLNVKRRSQIVVNVNGSTTNNFSFNVMNGSLSLPMNLILGSNIVVITATNNAGSDSKTATINYVQTPKAQPPVVTITSPPSSPYTVTAAAFVMKATIQHVTNRSQVNVTYNGAYAGSFTFNASTGEVTLPVTLNQGANNFVVTATNTAGSDSKSAVVEYKQKKVVLPPTVVITDPAVSPHNTQSATYVVKAKSTNISASSQVSVTFNGSPVTNFTFNRNTGEITFGTNLISGSNNATVKVHNSAGSDQASTVIIYSQPQQVLPPTVTIIYPAFSPYKSSTCSETIQATITNVATAQGVSVTKDGAAVPASKWTYSGGQFTMTDNIQSTSTYVIKGTNSAGSAQASTTIQCNQSQQVLPPTVTIIYPAFSPYKSSTCSETIQATITNVATAQGVSVTKDGAAVPASKWTYSGGQFTMTDNIQSTSTYVIKGTNSAGSAQASTTIECDKMITICHIPPGNPNNPQTIQIPQSAWPAHQAHGDSKGACPTPTPPPSLKRTQPGSSPYTDPNCKADVKVQTTNVSNKSELSVTKNGSAFSGWSFSGNMVSWSETITGTVTYVVTATTNGGTASETVIVKCDPKITICHIPPGNPNNPQTIQIPQSAWPAHQAHGDSKGACPTPTPPPSLKRTQPGSSPYTDPNCKADVKVQTTNVSNKSELSVTKNGSAFSGWSFSGNIVSWTETITGTVTYVVTATTKGGTASETVIVKCDPKITICHIPPGNPNNPQTIQIPQSAWPAHQAHGDSKGACPAAQPAPTLKRVKPAKTPYTDPNCKADIQVQTTNVSKALDITVTRDGATYTGWTFANNMLTWTETITGAVTYVVTATTSGGTASETIIVKCDKKVTICHIPPGNPGNPQTINVPQSAVQAHLGHGDIQGACPSKPVIYIKKPYNGSSTTKSSVQFQATVNNVSSKNDVSLRVNGQSVSFTYNQGGNVMANLTLTKGSNTIQITGTNIAGSVSQSITVTYNQSMGTGGGMGNGGGSGNGGGNGGGGKKTIPGGGGQQSTPSNPGKQIIKGAESIFKGASGGGSSKPVKSTTPVKTTPTKPTTPVKKEPSKQVTPGSSTPGKGSSTPVINGGSGIIKSIGG